MIALTLTPEMVNLLLAILSEAPYKTVKELIDTILNQANANSPVVGKIEPTQKDDSNG